jgi:ADP-heptose:LPS heptosyltransferase
MKFLVIRFSSIGDIVLTTPAIRCLKQQVKGAEVHFLTKASFKAVTEANPFIDKFYYFKDNLPQLIDQFKNEKYDYIIDLHKNLRTLQIKWALGCKYLSYNKEMIPKYLLTKFHLNFMSGKHISDRCVDSLKPLGVINDKRGLDYFIPPHEKVVLSSLPESHRNGFVAIVIGASYYTKKLPVKKLQEICSKLTRAVILLGGKEDFIEGNKVASVDEDKIFNACGKFTLNQSADLVRQSIVVISHDTGLQYIASALNKKVLAIWGGTSPKLDVEPYYSKDTGAHPMHYNFIVPNLACQPCSNFGTKTCPKGHFKCMMLQDVNAIADLANRLS